MTKPLHDQLKELAEKLKYATGANYRVLRLRIRTKCDDNLPAILSALKNDQRYRWIRKQISDDMQWYLLDKTVSAPEEFDAAIDAAQSQEER